MRKLVYIFIVVGLFSVHAKGVDFQGQLFAGYDIGKGFDVAVTAEKFVKGLPLSARLGVSHATFDPGDAINARKIFINNNRGGTIKKSGSTIGARLDFLYPVRIGKTSLSYFYFGPRTVRFKANFKYIGNNEDFDVVSKHWGWGAGIESGFPISRKATFLINSGLEYFFASTLYGHDTSYSPNGEKNNQRENYEYADADAAINQPKIEFRLVLGLSYRLGKQ